MKHLLLLAACGLSLSACRTVPAPSGASHYVALHDEHLVVCATPLEREGDRLVLPWLWVEADGAVELEEVRFHVVGRTQEETMSYSARKGDPRFFLANWSEPWEPELSVELSVKHSGSAEAIAVPLR